MKNNLTDSIYKAWRTGILPLVTALLLLTGCEMDSDMNLPLNVDSNKYTLTSDAGSTQVRIYSTGEWSVRLSEDVEWASINRLNGSGNTPVLFKYGANYGVPRTVDIIFTRGGLEQAVRMRAKTPSCRWRRAASRFSATPGTSASGLTTTSGRITNRSGTPSSIR